MDGALARGRRRSVSPRLARHRALIVGFLLGAALAVSLKTVLLILAGGVAWLTMPGLRMVAATRKPFVRTIAPAAIALLIVPGAFAAYFMSRGILHEALYGIFVHNLAPDLGRHSDSVLRILIPLLGYPLALGFAWWKRGDERDARSRPRRWILLSSVLYLLLLYGCWPLITHQDLLPVIPLVAIGIAATIVPTGDTDAIRLRVVLAALFAAVDAINLATAGVPLHNERVDEQQKLARVLSLTRVGDYVMDAKGESIFRHRPVYWVLEGVTEARMREGSIVDDIGRRLAATGTPVVIRDRLPPRDAAFVDANYIPIKPASGLIHVAGQRLGRARAGVAVAFEIGVPADYAIVTPDGRAGGMLDGVELGDARHLAPGRHVFVPSVDSGLAVVWSPALQRGLKPGELFTTDDR